MMLICRQYVQYRERTQRGIKLAKYQDKKNTGVPNWVRYSAIAAMILFVVAVLLVASGIVGQHWQHIAHNLNINDMPKSPETT